MQFKGSNCHYQLNSFRFASGNFYSWKASVIFIYFWIWSCVGISVFCLVSGVCCLLPSFFCLLSGVRGLYGTFEGFSRVPITFRGRKAVLCLLAVFAFKIKVSLILKMIQWNCQSTRQNWPVSELGTALLFNRFWFQNLPSHPKSYWAFQETGPRCPLSVPRTQSYNEKC